MLARVSHPSTSDSTSFGELAQAESLDLPRRGLGQLGDEMHPLRPLVRGELRADELLQFLGQLRRRRRISSQDHECYRLHEAVVILATDDAALEHGGVVHGYGYALAGADPMPADLRH